MLKALFVALALLITSHVLLPAKFIGHLNTNEFDADSVRNQFGRYGSPFSPDSINNQFGRYGNQFSDYSVSNPFAMHAPKLYTQNGMYLGKLSANTFDLESVSNSFGIYGNKYSINTVWSLYNSVVISIFGE